MTVDQALARIPYLEALPRVVLEQLARACAFRPVAQGERLFGEGEAPAGIFLIVEGRIKVVRASASGREQVLHEEGPGVTLAEVPVFDGGGAVGTAVASEDATVLFVPRVALLDALKTDPASSLAVIRVLASRVRKLARMVETLSLRSVTARVAEYLCREVRDAGGATFELGVTRDELAAHVGSVREQVSRALSQLQAAGVLRVRGRAIIVLDMAALHGLADGNVQNDAANA